MSRHLRSLTFAATLLLLAGCPKGSDLPDGGSLDGSLPQGDGGAGQDGGWVDAGPLPCSSDFEDCGTGEICELVSGECVPGGSCNPSYGYANCNYDAAGNQSAGAGCLGEAEQDCVCDPRDETCKKRRLLCEPCAIDEECGSINLYDVPASCVDLAPVGAGAAGEKGCLAKASARGCPAGYVPDGTNAWCIPDAGSCADAFACTTDVECPPSKPVCNLTTGTCTRGCSFNLETGDSTCPTGKVCDMDGKCRAPCDQSAIDCTTLNPDFICREDTGGIRRCRVSGCIDTLECEVPDGSPYTGFCEKSTHVCVTDACRPELSAADGSSPDCRLPNLCTAEGRCEPMTCVQRGGAAVSCAGANNICCGECRNEYLQDPLRDTCDPVPCTGTELPAPEGSLEGCVTAPNPPFCQACAEDPECVPASQDWIRKEDSRDRALCNGGLCLNTCATATDCPSMWACSYLYLGCDPTQADPCGAGGVCVDDGPWGVECPNGNECPEGSDCLDDPTDPLGNRRVCHSEFWICDCAPLDSPPQTANCPQSSRCAETGFQKHRCVASRVCMPGPGSSFCE